MPRLSLTTVGEPAGWAGGLRTPLLSGLPGAMRTLDDFLVFLIYVVFLLENCSAIFYFWPFGCFLGVEVTWLCKLWIIFVCLPYMKVFRFCF